ncbi:MAG TPA: antibiotic biosynthesis monooxygenase [Ferruginibacter sp.]|nr:antibiotic biosynthesis monooxygenase [Ferruginibacter sp.]
MLTAVLQFGFAKDSSAQTSASVDGQQNWMVRLAKIEIDTAYLKEYRSAIEVHTSAALKNEPGVLTLYVMQEKKDPSKITVLEIYASKEAYQAHIKTPHFLQYKNGTLHMVKKLELIDMDPLALGVKPDLFVNLK